MNTDNKIRGNGDIWFDLFAGQFRQREGQCASVKVADGVLDGQAAASSQSFPTRRTIIPAPSRAKSGFWKAGHLARW